MKLFSPIIVRKKYKMYENIPSSYPKEFFYNLSKLQGSMSKNLVKITADRVNADPSTITNIRMPIGSLVNLESLCLYFDVDIKGSNPTIPARYSSSFIKRLSLTMNNVSVQIIQDYNLVYNMFADFKNKDKSKGVAGEFLENTIIWSEGAGAAAETAITGANALLAGTTAQTGLKMCINNWLGFFGSSTTKIVNTDLTGEIVVSVEWAPNYECLGGTAEATATTYTASDTYEVKNIYMTAEALSFSDDTYYNSIGNKDLMIGFDDYIITKFASVQKTAGINCTTYVNAGNLCSVWGTAIMPQSVPKPMVGYSSGGDGAAANVINSYKYLSDPVAYDNNNGSAVSGDGFYNVAAHQRQLQHLETSQFSINNKALNYAPLNPTENFQNLLLTLGYENVDASANGFHSGVISLLHFYKYYGVACQSLELIDRDQFTLSGLNSQGSSCAINWTCTFSGGASNTLSVVPVIVSKLRKVLHIKPGRQIMVE